MECSVAPKTGPAVAVTPEKVSASFTNSDDCISVSVGFHGPVKATAIDDSQLRILDGGDEDIKVGEGGNKGRELRVLPTLKNRDKWNGNPDCEAKSGGGDHSSEEDATPSVPMDFPRRSYGGLRPRCREENNRCKEEEVGFANDYSFTLPGISTEEYSVKPSADAEELHSRGRDVNGGSDCEESSAGTGSVDGNYDDGSSLGGPSSNAETAEVGPGENRSAGKRCICHRNHYGGDDDEETAQGSSGEDRSVGKRYISRRKNYGRDDDVGNEVEQRQDNKGQALDSKMNVSDVGGNVGSRLYSDSDYRKEYSMGDEYFGRKFHLKDHDCAPDDDGAGDERCSKKESDGSDSDEESKDHPCLAASPRRDRKSVDFDDDLSSSSEESWLYRPALRKPSKLRNAEATNGSVCDGSVFAKVASEIGVARESQGSFSIENGAPIDDIKFGGKLTFSPPDVDSPIASTGYRGDASGSASEIEFEFDGMESTTVDRRIPGRAAEAASDLRLHVDDVVPLMYADEAVLVNGCGASSVDVSEGSTLSNGIHLTGKQAEAFRLYKQEKNIFVSGPSGTGKSAVIRAIARDCLKRKRNFVVLGPTHVAAMALGDLCKAETPNRFAGFNIPRTFAEILDRTLDECQGFKDKWKQLDVLVLEEIGMWNADLLDILDQGARLARGVPDEAFGGIQVCVFGDFGQLMPIDGKKRLKEVIADIKEKQLKDPASALFGVKSFCSYAFQSVCWREANFKTVVLDVIHRQAGDNRMIAALLDMRMGKVTENVLWLAATCSTQFEQRPDIVMPEGLKPTCLYSTNKMVDEVNERELDCLDSPEVVFDSHDYVVVGQEVRMEQLKAVTKKLEANAFFRPLYDDSDDPETQLRRCRNPERAPSKLALKVGAQVIVTSPHPHNEKIKTGMRGHVVRWMKVWIIEDHFKIERASKPDRRLATKEEMAKFRQRYERDPKEGDTVVSKGKKYTVVNFDVDIPVVRFPSAGDLESEMVPVLFDQIIPGLGSCVRLQIGLRLAWAMTVHRVQGGQLDWLKVDLTNCFAVGQAYCAIGRGVHHQQLEWVSFNPAQIKAHVLFLGYEEAIRGGPEEEMRFFKRVSGELLLPIGLSLNSGRVY